MLGQASISDNEKEYDPLVPVEHERVNHGRGTLRLDIGVQRQQIAGVVGAFERGEVTEGFLAIGGADALGGFVVAHEVDVGAGSARLECGPGALQRGSGVISRAAFHTAADQRGVKRLVAVAIGGR